MEPFEKILIAGIVAILILCPSALLFQANMESATYNKLTGAETTWWDALWVELRVQGSVKEDK